jgi:hypothetical protein
MVSWVPQNGFIGHRGSRADVLTVAPLQADLGNGTWQGSTTLSKCCNQLLGMMVGPPPPIALSSASTKSPSSIFSKAS